MEELIYYVRNYHEKKIQINTAISIRPLPGRNCVSFYRSGLKKIWKYEKQLYKLSFLPKSDRWTDGCKVGQGRSCRDSWSES